MMMMMTSAQIRAAGQGSGGGGAQLLRAGCPQGGVVAVGLQSGGRSGLCCPGGSQTNVNAVDGGGKVVWMLLSRTPRAVCPGSSPCPDGATNAAVTPEGGGGPGAKPARVEPLGWWQREGSRGALPVARGEE